MECKNKKGVISIVFLVAAFLIKFLTEWTIWIPVVLVVLAIAGLTCKGKCKCCSSKEEETPTDESSEASVKEEEVKEEPVVEETPVDEPSETLVKEEEAVVEETPEIKEGE